MQVCICANAHRTAPPTYLPIPSLTAPGKATVYDRLFASLSLSPPLPRALALLDPHVQLSIDGIFPQATVAARLLGTHSPVSASRDCVAEL